MNAQTMRTSTPRLVFDRPALDVHHELTETALAARLGVNPSTLWRLTKGEVEPSGGFIARVVLAFPDVPMSDIFHALPASEAVA